MELYRLSRTTDGFIGWIEPDNSKPIQYIPQPYKHPSAPYEHKFTNTPVYGRNYFLIHPDKFQHLPKNQFILNTAPMPYAFPDAWIKP